MGTITLSMPDDLKSEMEQHPIMNWSAVAREAIKERLNELKIMKAITAKSRLSDKDADKIGRLINSSAAAKLKKMM